MRDKTLLVAVMLLSLAFVCFVSAPVTLAEDPWDVDGNGGGSDHSNDEDPPPDSNSIFEPFEHIAPDPGDNPDWLDILLWQLTHGFAISLTGTTGGANAHAAAAGTAGGGSAAR